VLTLARAMLAAAEHEDQRVVSLQLGQAVHHAVLVRQLEIRQGHSWLQLVGHFG
jgi:hypothetical protein